MSIFSQVPATKISRSSHNLSHQVKASFDPGKINPLLCELAFPGDTWKVGMEQFVRSMPMIAPLMDMCDIKVDSFFIPLRLIWDDFEDFISLGPTGEFSAIRPTISRSANSIASANLNDYNKIFGVGGLADFLNFPIFNLGTNLNNEAIKIDALPFRAYQLVYNEYFRNEVLDPELIVETSSGDLSLSNTSLDGSAYINNFFLQNRGWNKDYFTSALPTPQKGPAVKIPFGDLVADGQMEFTGPSNVVSTVDGDLYAEISNVDPVDPITGEGGTVKGKLEYEDMNAQMQPLSYHKGLKFGTLPTIEELRYSEVLQEYYEANARGGTRYKEYLQNIWHTRTRDSRLDRPEYLGGYRGPLSVTDVDQTSQSATTAQGTLAGKGVSAGGNKLFRYHVPEFGIILITMSLVTKASYYQGFRRWNLYDDVFDWPNPFFANLGEQEIFNKELYHANDGEDDDTFGYTPRYAEAKFIPNSVHGQFKTTLDYWHLGRKFGSRPNLNSAFIHMDPAEFSRIFPSQVSGSDKFVGTFFFHVQRKEYLPYWGVPRLIHSL